MTAFSDYEELVKDTFHEIDAYTSEDAVTVTMMIIAHESGQGKHRRQIGAKFPALGLGQMERATFDTVVKYGEKINSYLKRAGYDHTTVKFEDIENDDRLAIIFIRGRLAMDPKPLPCSLINMSKYCKDYWNAGGKASAKKYFWDYVNWRNDD